MTVEETISIGMNYLKSFLSFVRDGISKLVGLTGIDGVLITMILFALISLFLARLITKRFVTRPFSGAYWVWTLIIALLFFIILMYL